MSKLKIGLIGYGTVGTGVVKLMRRYKAHFRKYNNAELELKTLCDRSIHKKDTAGLGRTQLTTDINTVLNDKKIDVVVELIGGMKPARRIVETALKNGKDVVTANKELIANRGKELFALARRCKRHIYFESSVGAGIPIIKTITEGLAGNQFNSIYGIINGTCNFILTEMSQKQCSFAQALEEAQRRGFAESVPTLDINGMDSTHKLAILVYLAFGKLISVKDIYTEGITHIALEDIAYAENLNLTIKLLAIAKQTDDKIEARVHPTLISKDHPIASINGVDNAVFLKAQAQGDILLSGKGAGQMPAASGVISDLINLAAQRGDDPLLSNLNRMNTKLSLRKIDQIQTKFYVRFMASDKPGVLSRITGILGKHSIGINSVTQKVHNTASMVPVVMITDYTTEKNLRLALNKIQHLPVIKNKPVAIRMEKLW